MYDTPFEKFQLLVGITDNSKDYLLHAVLDQAAATVKGYTRRDVLNASMMDIAVKLAVIYYNRLGAEGETARTEGAVSRSFDSTIPEDIRLILNRYIKARVM